MDGLTTTPAPLTTVAPVKRGRPRKTYRTSWDTHVDGLLHRTDGRWQIVATGQIFTERDERKAVHRAQQIINKLNGATFTIETPVSLIRGTKKPKPRTASELTERVEEAHEIARVTGTVPSFDYTKNPDEWTVANTISGSVVWPWLREMLINRPEFVADMVGIPEVARLADLPKRGPSPSLDKVGEEYRQRAKVTDRALRLAHVLLHATDARPDAHNFVYEIHKVIVGHAAVRLAHRNRPAREGSDLNAIDIHARTVALRERLDGTE